jgi:flagellar basal-body rod protein FlgG
MAAQQQRLDAVANDLANANTNGYKHVRVGFADLLYEQGGRPSAPGVMLGTGARAVDAGRSFQQGSLRHTDNPLDVAIQGEGFIPIRLADGRRALTRDGALHIDGNRRIVTATGAQLDPPITVPAGTALEDIAIASDGTVRVDGRQVGRIQLVTVRSTQGLLPVGENAFVTTPASGNATAAPRATTLQQGVLEGSNTDMAQAMVDLMDAQRTYQLTSKAIQTADQMMEIANGVKR